MDVQVILIAVPRGEKIMKSITYPQCRIVPIRMLQPDNAEKFLDGLSYVPGIRRILVQGPGYYHAVHSLPIDKSDDTPPVSSDVKIADQNTKMYVLLGSVIVEAEDESILHRVGEYCSDFFDDFDFQILVGTFIKPEPSLSDYAKNGSSPVKNLVGLSDYRHGVKPFIIKQDSSECSI